MLATVIAGVIGVGALVLATAPQAAMAFVLILAAALSWALIAAGDPAYLMVQGLLMLYSFGAVGGVLWISRLYSAPRLPKMRNCPWHAGRSP